MVAVKPRPPLTKSEAGFRLCYAREDRCSVAPHSLNWNPPYEALSYSWGDLSDVCAVPIDFNGFPKYISTNLEAALRVLRHQDKPRQLWIDALCINQNDDAEKSKQVAMMGAIFAQAQNVIIWLGPESADSNLAMSTISGLKSSSDFENVTEPAWDAIENLFSRPWFSRIWVLQEFKRAKNPLFHCGQASFNFDKSGELLAGFWDAEQTRPMHTRLLGELGKVVSMASTRVELPLDSSLDTQQAAANLVRMLRIHGGCKATVPHDKIYGLQGLSDAFSFPGSNPPTVSYDKNVLDVYTDWARYLILSQSSLDLLYVSQRMLHDPSLPSWVPDWRTARHDLLFTLNVFRESFRYTGPSIEISDTALKFHDNGRVLVVKGYIIAIFNPGFMFFPIQPDFITSKLSSTPRKELLRACLMMGCRLKNSAVEGFAASGITEGRKQFRGFRGSTGLVPKATRHGDIICMLAGADIPFVLRPVEEEYELVGDGYIENGGVVDSLPNAEIRTFKIR
ncbi:Heterokaryon incompatibility protein 6 OR allele [Lachnellula suecica]|uniref:Heterokaryon incompatibility protein 6 OR allele n=1 Tax=Lachnellula suecica TaxID=602035 RepID=A0A8T9BVH1_9HELO|nr:Heterokaryon incompatibility protein 6 OR allele [Lachnellula suecica]